MAGRWIEGCDGRGSKSNILQGIDWVTANAKKPAVANMSLGGGASRSVDDAVERSARSGVLYSLAAGNGGEDACSASPAKAGAGTDNGIVTTAATDILDGETATSNYGPCVDLWAPGAGILSTRKGGGITKKSGTSRAAPHVGGGAALYLSSHPGADPAATEGALKAAAARPGTTSKDGRDLLLEHIGEF
jgi:subtilisin family serine protease